MGKSFTACKLISIYYSNTSSSNRKQRQRKATVVLFPYLRRWRLWAATESNGDGDEGTKTAERWPKSTIWVTIPNFVGWRGSSWVASEGRLGDLAHLGGVWGEGISVTTLEDDDELVFTILFGFNLPCLLTWRVVTWRLWRGIIHLTLNGEEPVYG